MLTARIFGDMYVSSAELPTYTEIVLFFTQLVSTILDQSHLSPLALNIQPSLSDYDHALRLYPLPTAVLILSALLKPCLIPLTWQIVLADKYEKYKMTYSGCHVFNPGSFVGKSFTFSTYNPAQLSSEEGYVISVWVLALVVKFFNIEFWKWMTTSDKMAVNIQNPTGVAIFGLVPGR